MSKNNSIHGISTLILYFIIIMMILSPIIFIITVGLVLPFKLGIYFISLLGL